MRKVAAAVLMIGGLAAGDAAVGVAAACTTPSETIAATALARSPVTRNKDGVRSVTWTLKTTQRLGREAPVSLIGGDQATWVRFSSDGRWTAHVGLESGLRVRAAKLQLLAGFAFGDRRRSNLLRTVRSGELAVGPGKTRWVDVGGANGPEGAMFDIILQRNVAPAWTLTCALGD